MRARHAILAVATQCLMGCGSAVVWYGKSPDRQRHVRVVEAADWQRVYLDGKGGRVYDGIGLGSITFSPDSRRLAYPARREDGKWVVVIDGRESEAWDGVGDIVFGPGSRQVVYLARRARQWHVVKDSHSLDRAEAVFAGTLQFGPDGRKLAWVAVRARKAQVVVNGKRGPLHDAVAGLTFSLDGARVGYAARDQGRWRMFVAGRPGRAYDRVAGLVFGPLGRLAYVAWHRSRTMIIANDEERPIHGAVRISSLVFNASGELLYVAGRKGSERLFVGGEFGPSFESIAGPVLSTDGRRWGYIGSRGDRHQVVVDGKPGPVHRWAGDLVLSSNGRRFAYLARRGSRMAVVHTGGRYEFDVVLNGSLVFSRDGRHLAFLAGNRAARKLFFAVDGRQRCPFDLEEFNAATAVSPLRQERLLRRWVAAELAAALRSRLGR